jgi:AraC-like DNA-binding protein
MDIILNQSGLTHLLHSFSTITNVRVGFFNPLGKEIIDHPKKECAYCDMINSSKEGDDACVRSDLLAYQQAVEYWAKGGKNYIYECHAGLIEMITPIVSSKNEFIGYLIIGKIQQPGYKEKWEKISRKIQNFCSDLDQLKAAYFNVPIMEMDNLKACGNILQALVVYMWQENYIRTQIEPLSESVVKFITANIDKNLSLPLIAKKFGIGKTTLCNYIKKDYFLSPNKLIRQIRIARAKELLQNTHQPVYQIAELVGIPDFNYFTKLFKVETGISPSMYRKNIKPPSLFKNNSA